MNATFILRFKAFVIDYLLILAYLLFLFVMGVFLFPSLQELFKGSLVAAQLSGFILVTLPVSIYFIISDSVIGRQSLGKRRTGIQVVDENSNKVSVSRMVFRTILKFLPWELSHYLVYRLAVIGDGQMPVGYSLIGVFIYVLLFAYVLTAIFTKKKQSLYDIIAKTQVVKVPSK